MRLGEEHHVLSGTQSVSLVMMLMKYNRCRVKHVVPSVKIHMMSQVIFGEGLLGPVSLGITPESGYLRPQSQLTYFSLQI